MRKLTAALVAGAFAVAAPMTALAAGPVVSAKVARDASGKPLLDGYWTNATVTNLERDPKYGDRAALTVAEWREIEKGEQEYVAEGNKPTDPSLKVTDLPENCGRGFSGTNCGYNRGWTDPGTTVMTVGGQPRTSFITQPANGRIPPMKPEAAARMRQLMQARAQRASNPNFGGPADNPEQRSLGERCLLSFGNSAGPVMLPLLYNNNYQFVQTKDEVAIVVEMVHDVRHVRLNTRQHLPAHVRPYMGDTIGWWEGDTLVAETTNFPANQNFRGASTNLKVTERFTRTGPDALLYQFRVEDPTVWESAWSGEYEFKPSKGLYEYACHEGNYALHGILAGAREEEKAAAAAKPAASAGGGGR